MALPATASASPGFYGLAELPEEFASASFFWVSDEGLAGGAASAASGGDSQAIVYSIGSGLRTFDTLPGGIMNALHVSGGSRDGQTLVGSALTDRGIQAFRYSEGSGTEILAPREAVGPTADWAQAFASDADRVVGSSNGAATVWDGGLGPVSLGSLNASFVNAYAYDASADGRRVVGKSWNESFDFQAFLWTEESGMIGLGSEHGSGYGEAVGISADGSTVVGITTEAGPYAPFVWTESSGLRPLAAPTGFGWSSFPDSFFSLDVSGDGSVVVGGGLFGIGSDPEAFIYSPTEGVRALSDHLESLGIDLAGWTLSEARAVSEDGRFIVGSGIDPSGRSSGWLVVIPEPGTAIQLALGLAVLSGLGASRSAGT
ncbi:MAG: hypothetical protein R3F21_06150 [Myxococcota bacterium]